MSPLDLSSSLVFTVDREHLKKVAHPDSGILSKINFHHQTFLELAPSLLEDSISKCQVTAFMGFVGDSMLICQELKSFARNHL